jgi:hypothetical protein
LANIGEEKTYETNFRQNILINALFSSSSPVWYGYPQQRLRYTQNSNYFPIVQWQIHIVGSKKKDFVFLASFGNHQYGLSGEIRNYTIHKIAIECSVLGLLKR